MSRVLAMFVLIGGLTVGCASAPRSEVRRASLDQAADEALQEMIARDPDLRLLLRDAVGYVVFPQIGQGGFIVGGGGGNGVVYQNGRVTGFAELNQASIGAQIGGQKFSELIIFRDLLPFDQMKTGHFDFGGQASATIVRAGVASESRFGQNGVAVFVQPIGGAMVNASLTGQSIRFIM